MKGRSSLLPVGADRHLPGGAVRWFDASPLRPVRSDCAKHMDDAAERHHTEEYQQTQESQAAGLQVRATRAGSWPNVSVSSFAAQPNSTPPRRSDNAVQKI